jgi:autotransporter translocation and assembly factor TamB
MRRLVRGLVALVALGIVLSAIAHHVARRAIEHALADALESRVSLHGLSGLTSGRLHGVGLQIVRHGAWRITVPDVSVAWSPRALLDRRLAIDRVVLRGARIAVTDRARDALPGTSDTPLPVSVSLGRIELADARVVVAVDESGTRVLYGADRIDLDVRPTFGGGAWSAAVRHLSLRPRGRPIPPITVAGDVAGRADRVDATLETRIATVGTAAITAALRLDRAEPRYRVTLASGGLDVRRLAAPVPVERVRGRAVVLGRSRAEGEQLGYAAVLETRLGGTAPLAGPASIRVSGHGRGATHRLTTRVVSGGVRASARGTVALDARSVDAHVAATADLRALGRRLGLELTGRAKVAADVRGPFATPRIAATIDAVDPGYGTVGLASASAAVVVEPRAGAVPVSIARLTALPRRGPAVSLAAPTTLVLGPTIALAPATLVTRDGRLLVGGRLGPGPVVDLSLGLQQVDLARACATLGLGECSGTLTATARVTGDGPAPRLDAVVRHSIGAELVVTGRVPFPWPAGGPPLARVPFALEARSDGFEAAALQPFAGGALVQLGGRIDAAVTITGPMATLALDGRLRLHDGRLEPAATRVRYSDVEIGLRLVPGAVVVDPIRARADGTLTGAGRVTLDGLTPGAIDVTVALERLRIVDLPAYQAAASGTLTLGGTPTAPTVRGDLELGPATIRPAMLPSGDVPTAPDPTIEVVGRAAPRAEPSGPNLADALALEVGVHVGDDVVVRRADTRIDLGGEVRLSKAAYGPLEAHGDVRLVRGWLEFQGRRFTVDPSAIRFDGRPDRPTLDLAARTRVREYDVVVQVTGTAVKPVLALTSEPPLEESDVLAVLLFGVPASELGQGQQADLQTRAVGLASNYVASGLTQSLRDTFGLDVFDVTVGEGEKPGAVRVGRYVTNDIFLSLAQEFGTRVGQAAALEYRLRPRVSVRLSTSTSGSSGIDVIWHRRY